MEMIPHPGGGNYFYEKVIAKVFQQSETIFFVQVGERMFSFNASDAIIKMIIAASSAYFHSKTHFNDLQISLLNENILSEKEFVNSHTV
jgi:hypothetical protein